jgi:hypothetical protein
VENRLKVYSNAVHVRKITGIGHGVHRTFRKPKIAEEERNCQKMPCKSEKSTCMCMALINGE